MVLTTENQRNDEDYPAWKTERKEWLIGKFIKTKQAEFEEFCKQTYKSE